METVRLAQQWTYIERKDDIDDVLEKIEGESKVEFFFLLQQINTKAFSYVVKINKQTSLAGLTCENNTLIE